MDHLFPKTLDKWKEGRRKGQNCDFFFDVPNLQMPELGGRFIVIKWEEPQFWLILCSWYDEKTGFVEGGRPVAGTSGYRTPDDALRALCEARDKADEIVRGVNKQLRAYGYELYSDHLLFI